MFLLLSFYTSDFLLPLWSAILASSSLAFRRTCRSAVMSETVLFDAQFQVKAIDPDGKKFDRGE
jgi:hypothetical protein